MRAVIAGALLFLFSLSTSVARAQPAGARHTTGAVTLRGVAAAVHHGGFSLKTSTHGTYDVAVLPQTKVTEKGKRGRLTVANGDHVRVRGFVHGSTISAVSVAIVPSRARPKEYSERGTVQSLSGTAMTIAVGTRSVRLLLTSHSVVDGAVARPGNIRKGDRVLVRVQPQGAASLAVHIHVYKRVPTGPHIQVRGTVASVSATAVTVSSSSHRYTIAVARTTSIRRGTSSASIRDLKAGEAVTVYACCGASLTATSIRILVSQGRVVSVTIRGVVTAISSGRLTVNTGHGTAVIVITSSTVASIGSAPVPSRDVRVGDEVTVRAVKAGDAWNAARIHVAAVSRAVRTLAGTVVSVSKTGMTVEARGKRYLIAVGPSTSMSEGSGKTTLKAVHPGDRARASGQLSGTTLRATHIAVTPVRPKTLTVRGVIVSVSSSGIVVSDGSGARYLIQPGHGVKVTLHGSPAPASALFSGVKVRAKGHVVGKTTLKASAVSISVESRAVSGRIEHGGKGQVTVRSSRASWVIDLSGRVIVRDGARALPVSALRAGAYMRARGYVERADVLRATSVSLLHPTISVSGVVVSVTGGLKVRTSAGDTYALHLSSGSTLSAGRTAIALTPSDIPAGAHVHVTGTVTSDGSIAVQTLTVHLSALTVRGKITAMTPSSLTLTAATGAIPVKILRGTEFMQGSTVLKPQDIVVGDDVTVYGYKATITLARKVLVHRKRMTLKGVVASVTADGFSLTAADGPHRILTSLSTLLAGPQGQVVTAGDSVRVSGYLRGDGVLLATRVTITKSG